MQSYREISQMPRLSLSQEELTTVVRKLLANSSDTFDFNTFVKSVANYLIKENIGFKAEPHTTYQPNLDYSSIALIREVIWDHIILRYLTIGNYGRDEWPALTITQRGKLFFESI
jgi:hypothetical protein